MRRAIVCIALGVAGLTGCGPRQPPRAEVAPQAPTVELDARLAGNLEVMAFKGGYGINFYEAAAREFEALHPGLTITVSGNPRVWEQIRPRMVAGNPPDLMFPGWGMDHWALVQEGQLMRLDAALDGPNFEGTATWRSTFDPKVLRLGQKGGQTYMLPYYTMVWGWWYDPGLFERHGWKPPATFPELLELAPKIMAQGIAPITFQGQFPYYMIEDMWLPWAGAIGGVEALNAAQNLEPGAWNSEPFLRSAEMIDQLNRAGFFQRGATGMSHTEAQTQFLNGNAAMIPCGTWLYSEMREVMPPGAGMRFMPIPDVPGGMGDPTMVTVSIEPWMVPAGARNPEAAIAMFRFMTSLQNAKRFVERKGTLMSILGSDQANLPEVLVEPARAVRNARTIWSNQYRQWYPAMQKEFEGALTSMLNGEITPRQFVDRCEAAAERTRNDEAIPKYRVP
jgi:N-acetylglucosamine transport system substrate-binding protein